MNQDQLVAISATFTAEPLEQTLDFWANELGLTARIEFAPYNQLFQQLLDPSSLLATNESGANVVLVRFEDWYAVPQQIVATVDPAAAGRQALEQNLRDLTAALRSAAERSATPYIVCFCPPSPSAAANAELCASFNEMEVKASIELEGTNSIHLLTSREIDNLYPVALYFDPLGNELGHIPYTPLFFAALGTAIARKIFAIRRAPYKVIALDCDMTLWNGVCGEDGALGIEIDGPRRTLQEFMVTQHDTGMLLCLCSKNNEADVVQVFDQRSDMALQREHLVSWRLNWEPKSENLKSLAVELDLGLDSFIFIDDNPIECAEVAANCPQVLTIPLPQDPELIPGFLKHLWAFDRLNITEEDRKRTALYRQNLLRERAHKDAPSLRVFLESLELQIGISDLAMDQIPRVSQLTQRTNQFNATTIRRSEGEILQIHHSHALECLTVDLRDRFGEYGLVGVMIFEQKGSALEVDTFLLSCRALGRGVEHRMLAHLGQIAEARGLSRVEVSFIRTERNQPVLNFLQGVGSEFRHPSDEGAPAGVRDRELYSFPAAYASHLNYEPPAVELIDTDKSRASAAGGSARHRRAAAGQRMVQIAMDLNSAEAILEAIKRAGSRSRPELGESLVAPRSSTEQVLVTIWEDVLNIQPVSVYDSFFELGGHSLLATQVLARIWEDLKVKLPLLSLFEAPTVAEMATLIEGQQIEVVDDQRLDELLAALEELSDEEAERLLSETIG